MTTTFIWAAEVRALEIERDRLRRALEVAKKALEMFACQEQWDKVEDGEWKGFHVYADHDKYGYHGTDGWEPAKDALAIINAIEIEK